MRTLLQHEFTEVINEVDVLITPTSPQPAERFDEFDAASPLRRSFTRPFNFTGMPAISLCCGFTVSGLPIGLQSPDVALLKPRCCASPTPMNATPPGVRSARRYKRVGAGSGSTLPLRPLLFSSKPLSQEIFRVTGREIVEGGEHLVAELLVERPRLETEGLQLAAPASPVTCVALGSQQELCAVPTVANRLRQPERCDVQPLAPDVSQNTT